MKLLPASTLDMSALAELFNAGFSEYLVPMSMDENGLREYLDTNGVDLDCSRIAVEKQAVAFTLIARRGTDGWVAGMGTVPSQRKRALGEQVLLAGIEAARGAGSRTVSLEVIDRNEPAIRLYRKLGFEPVREMLVWLLAPAGAPPPACRTVEPDVAHAWIVGNRRSREPWQRADETVASVRARGSARLGGLVIERGGEVRAAALVVERGDQVSVLQIAALDREAASDALLAAAGGNRGVRLTNVPGDEPASTAMRELEAELVARQHEMVLSL